MYNRAIQVNFLKPKQQAQEIRRWARMMQTHALAAIQEQLETGKITQEQHAQKRRQIIGETHHLITCGFKVVLKKRV